MIRQTGFLFLAFWLTASLATADPAAVTPALRRVTDAEFQQSLTNSKVRTDVGVVLSHGHAETFLAGGRYRVTSGPLQSLGTYRLKAGVICARTDAEPGLERCRVILTDGQGRFFSRPARSIDDQSGEGFAAELKIDRGTSPPSS